KLLFKLINRGHMPHLKKLLKKSFWGTNKSTIPPVTAPAWISFATGVDPSRHSCFNFLEPDTSLTDAAPINSAHIRSKTVFEYLEDAGKTSVIINLPGSYPPRIKKGIMLPSFLTVNAQEIHPANLISQIPELKDYKVITNPRTWFGDGDELVKETRELEENKFTIAKKIFNKFSWDVFFILFSGSDWIQHRKYKYLENYDRNKIKDSLKYYENFDRYLQWFTDNCDKDTTLLLVSDHGFQSIDYFFHLNTWLKDKGLLRHKRVFSNRSSSLPLGVYQLMGEKKSGTVSTLVKKTLVNMLTYQPLYCIAGDTARMLYAIAPKSWNIIPRGLLRAGLELDIEHTYACMIPGSFSGIYINTKKRFTDGIVTDEEYDHVREEIIHGLSRLKRPDGKKVFNYVVKKENIYDGPYLDRCPDILFEENGTLVSNEYSSNTQFEEVMHGEGYHDPNGIVLINNTDTAKEELFNISLVDIAPTILDVLGLQTPDTMTGESLLSKRKKVARRLQLFKKSSETLIKKQLTEIQPSRLALFWTGGKDSTVLLWLIKNVCAEEKITFPRILIIDTGDVFDELNRFIRNTARKWNISYEFIRNDDVMKQAKKVGDIVYVSKLNAENKAELKKIGFTGKSFRFEPESYVGNHLMKTVPMNACIVREKLYGVFIGIRKDEHEARSHEKSISKRTSPKHIRIHPLLDYKERDIWDMIHSFTIPYSDLYTKGFRSLGVKTTTHKTSDTPAWEQDLKNTKERQGRRQDKEKIMERLRQMGYM
ncbi:MAG: alkaline phosphatase family protein, partial [Candidatus Roizmanbacteria bacterium]|nr:alkaline phosphatase family protein [Candidatus Roizmanbacteria bacterium]